jgi:hypothetical protein
MDSPVFISYFNQQTRSEFLAHGMQYLGSRTRSKMPVGSIVALYDLTEHVLFGVVRVRNAPDKTTPCIEHAWLDVDTYSMQYQQYNRWEIHIHEVKILKSPLGYDRIALLVGGDTSLKGHGNMWKKNRLNFARPFQMGSDPSVVRRYNLLINTLMD